VTVAGQPLPLTVSVVARNPRTKAPADGFTIEGSWRAVDGYLRLDGLVTAPGDEDQVADLVIRVAGAELPLGTMADDPLLLPRKLLSRLPLVSLRAEGEDRLALAVPPDRLVLHSFAASEGGVELHFPFGFSRETKPELRLRAPFACLLYSTDPRWHYRAALERYYGFFAEPFRPFTREHGGWFFAAETKDLPNPQHFRFHEGGPWGVDEDEARGLGTYPYRESSSATISLEGSQQPKDQAEAMARFEELERRRVPEGWQPQQAFTLDESKAFAGQRSLLADSGATGVWTGALQQVTLPQPEAGPITVSGRSKADGISGEPDNNYSIYVDAVLADGSYLFGQCASFRTGTHDWEESTFTFQAKQPVVSLRVFCLLRHHHGRAWFDEVRVGPAARPEVNWLRNSGFEELREPAEYRYIRDNVCLQPDGRWAFHITNNLSADVPPDAPMNLLRFSLNVDPDLPASDAHPTPASQTIAEFDSYFRQFPSIDGVYIDSVSAWCSYIYNTRREHWPAADEPLTYDPRTLAVASHGRFAMMDYLRALQERYHLLGKAVFTNIHTEQASFPLYLVSDIPGIESSAFQDEEALFFYRASSYHKPLLLMNYLNLHKLDDREVALRFHLNAAQWGLLPSTGRGVQQAYRLYGDVTHRYLPAIAELSEAGWEPVPHTAGRAERFGRSLADSGHAGADRVQAAHELALVVGELGLDEQDVHG
ncbi:MAG: hypothetical protein HUU35_17925, partial [Armatimonadetes bacterium]|nr:hypothetical protein [Armatimonadota bacterium]